MTVSQQTRSMDKEIFVHIGAPKTGTSYLRNCVFPYIQNVYFENKHNYRNDGSFPLSEYFSAIAHMGDGDELSAEIDGIQMPSIENPKILISEEHFIWSIYHMMGNIGSRALLLKRAVPSAKIIITIRRQPEFFISLFKYFQTLKKDHLKYQLLYIENMLNIRMKLDKFSLKSWNKVPCGCQLELSYQKYSANKNYFNRNFRHFIAVDFSWTKLVKLYQDLFGKKNVLVIPQELILNERDKALNLLSLFVGEKINPVNYSGLVNSTDMIKNPFKNKEHKKAFINYVLKKNNCSNMELNKSLKYLDIESLGYIVDESNLNDRIKIYLGKKEGNETNIRTKLPARIVNYLDIKRRIGSKAIVLTFLHLLKKKLITLYKLNGRKAYRSFLFLTDWFRRVDFEKIESVKTLLLNPNFSEQYESTKIFELKKVIKRINISQNSAVVDFGSGKGRVLYFFSKIKNVEAIYGIEISEKLSEICRQNMHKLKTTNVYILNIDARDTPEHILDKCNIFYFYNPFPKKVLEDIFYKIEFSIKKKNRLAYIIYFNPLYDQCMLQSDNFKFFGSYHNHLSNAGTSVFVTLNGE